MNPQVEGLKGRSNFFYVFHIESLIVRAVSLAVSVLRSIINSGISGT